MGAGAHPLTLPRGSGTGLGTAPVALQLSFWAGTSQVGSQTFPYVTTSLWLAGGHIPFSVTLHWFSVSSSIAGGATLGTCPGARRDTLLLVPCQGPSCPLTPFCSLPRGRSPEWYNRVFGHLCAMELVRIRDSFPALSPSGPETKI